MTRRGTHCFLSPPSHTPPSSSRSEKVTAIKWKPLRRRRSLRPDCSFILNRGDRDDKPSICESVLVVTLDAVIVVLAGGLDYKHQTPENPVYKTLYAVGLSGLHLILNSILPSSSRTPIKWRCSCKPSCNQLKLEWDVS